MDAREKLIETIYKHSKHMFDRLDRWCAAVLSIPARCICRWPHLCCVVVLAIGGCVVLAHAIWKEAQ